MHRRGLLAGTLALLGSAACTTGGSGPRGMTFSLDRLQTAVATRFPQRVGTPDLLELALLSPRLRLLPEANRLGLQLDLQAGGPLIGREYGGAADVDFGLRYEARDHTLRATQLRVLALTLDELPPRTAQLARQSLNAWVRQSLAEVVVYRLRAQDLALADGLGLQPGAITVTPEGVEVQLLSTLP